MSLREHRVHLRHADRTARIRPDGYSEHGVVLEIGDGEQSHVDLADPTLLRHEYLRRVAHLIDTCAVPTAPITVLHLGAGALTLVRYIQATRPGSAQVVVEIERELPNFVTAALPLPEGTMLRTLIGDARTELARMSEQAFDVIVPDVFSGESTPLHLTGTDFFGECLDHLGPDGLLAVNIGDDAGLRFFGDQARALESACYVRGLAGAWTLADAQLLAHLTAGNLILAAGPGIDRAGERHRDAWLAAGPHPAQVLDAHETARLADRISHRS